ncbi:Protein kinase [Ceratobasidium sp. 423]|nr:Protein kinase [Ceratobasidium sp. 423]
MSSREPSADSRKRLGEYQVLKNIGEGSFGHVKLAIHTLTGQKVALKYFSKARIKNMKLGARVTREIQYLRLLDHPHIVKIYEVITTPTDIIMVIEFAGAELFDTLAKHGRLSEGTARSIFQQLVSAVAHSHKCKVIHRDLKPENILIDWSAPVPDVKVIDFGLSNGDNAIKVAYNIAKDKRRKTLNWSERMRTQEEASDVAATTGMMSNLMVSNSNQPTNYETDSTAYDTDEEWEFDWNGEEHNIAVLNSSLPVGQPNPDAHHLTSYAEAHANAQSQEQVRAARTANPTTDIRKKTKWHFGIRSRSPPMEVMLELYNTLKALGWEWREKPNLGKRKALAPGEEADPREDSDIFFLETRCRINDVVIRTDLQLYQVDAINYLVDFRNVGYYHATGDPANDSPFATIDSSQVSGGKIGAEGRKLDDITSPFLFLESACRLIQQLAGV